jgi:uncharacterized integral membrane protein
LPTLNLIFILIISLLLILIAVQNTALIEIRFLWFSAKIPIIALIFIAVVGGFALGYLLPAII